MNILFLTNYKWPHIGGVEKHVFEIGKRLRVKGESITIVSEEDIKYPHIKFLGLIYIWFWLFKNRKLIENSDVVHCHDVFIWYLPFRFIFPKKKVVTTIHGWEDVYPMQTKFTFFKKIAFRLSTKTIGIGNFLEKYLNIKFDLISYGAVTAVYKQSLASQGPGNTVTKDRNRIVYVGRLEENTGLLEFLGWLKNNPKYRVDFCGDGSLRKECEKFGSVHGFTDPNPFYKKAKICVPGGYLAALEALSYDCELKLFANSKVKEDYWKMSPFYQLKGKKLYAWAREQTWDKLTNEYLDLYKSTPKS